MQLIVPRDTVALINEVNPEGTCPICQNDFEPNEWGVVSHEKENPIHNAHLIHRLCWKNWCETRNPPEFTESNCVTCAVPVNVRPLFQLTAVQRILRDSPKILARVLLAAYTSTAAHVAVSPLIPACVNTILHLTYPINKLNSSLPASRIITEFKGSPKNLMRLRVVHLIMLSLDILGSQNTAFGRNFRLLFGQQDERFVTDMHAWMGSVVACASVLHSMYSHNTAATVRTIANTGMITAVLTGALEVLRSIRTS